MNNLKVLKPRKALNKAFLKVKPNRTEIESFKANLITLLDRTNDTESEEFHKNLVIDFLKKTYYDPHHFINTKGRNDLVIHNGPNANSTVGVIIEAKKPTNKTEMPQAFANTKISKQAGEQMITTQKLNAKAFQELVLYYLRERITHKNLEIKHLVATNINEWFIFDATLFDRLFAQNKNLVKQFNDFESGRLADTKTDFFYKQIAEPFIDRILAPLAAGGAGGGLEFTYFNIQDFQKPLRNTNKADDHSLIALFKLLSPEHLLKLPFTNDSNSLDKRFYSELLHLIGLTETKEGSKKLIDRNKAGERHTGTILEDAIIQLDSLDKLSRLEKSDQFGNTQPERLFNVALELTITWINRILFLKLLEAQLITYHKGDKSYSFLNLDKIKNYDDLNSMFFQVLARRYDERNEDVKNRFEKVPYLNSSLFEPTDLEQVTLFISNLKDDKTIPVFSQTVLKDRQGKKRTGSISTLQYLFEFLDAYDFGAEGGEEIQEDNKTLINASVLGLIFEKINGYKDGSFFTPGFITMYMCRETIRKAVVQKFVHEFPDFGISRMEDVYDLIPQKISRKKANEIINSLKICDPAVGSGHFLVSALNEIIAVKNDLKILEDKTGKSLHRCEVEVVNDELIVTDEEGELFEYNPGNKESQRIQETLFHEKQTIIENCLFGVDINSNSVKICRLRLWIELLKNAYYIQSSSPNSSSPDLGEVSEERRGQEQLNNLPYLKTFRKALRNNLTPAEAKLWTMLKGKQMDGRKFRRQHSFANYILDFYCPEERLAIELDGQGHFEATQAEYDRERDLFLETFGIRVLRFENKWVWDNPEGLLEKVRSYFGKQPPQSSSPDKGRWSQTGGVNISTQPPRPADTPPYKGGKYDLPGSTSHPSLKGGELKELQTLPNIDINIKCGNSLVSRFAIDADLKQALKKSKWTIDTYRIAVDTYRNAQSKEQKKEMERLIADIKSDFRTEIAKNDPKLISKRKLEGDLFNLMNQTSVFELTDKEKKTKSEQAEKIAQQIQKLETEMEEIKANRIFENAFEWRFEFPEVLNDEGDFVGFDVVIGNPPYIRQEELGEFKNHLQTNYKVFTSGGDIFSYFYELSHSIMKDRGYFSFINNTFDKTTAGRTLREFVENNFRFERYIDFTDVVVFEEATTYPIILIAQKANQKSNFKFFKYTKANFYDKELLSNTSIYTEVAQDKLNTSAWNFINSFEQNLLVKIQSHKSIVELFGKCYYGVKTALNEAFVTENKLGRYTVLKDVYDGKDLKKWTTPRPFKKMIVFECKSTSKSFGKLSEDVAFEKMKETYPEIFNHLEAFKEKAKERYDKGEFWWELRNCAYYDLFDNPKIIFPNLQNSNKFAFDDAGVYLNAPAVFLPSNDKALLAVLNSKVVWHFLKSVCVIRSGGYIEVKPQYFEQIPIPDIDAAIQNTLTELADKAINEKTNNQQADITEIENQIDQLVYQLYDLTEEEIAIIESSNR